MGFHQFEKVVEELFQVRVFLVGGVEKRILTVMKIFGVEGNFERFVVLGGNQREFWFVRGRGERGKKGRWTPSWAIIIVKRKF